MSIKIDLTQYNNNELSNIVFNTWDLYYKIGRLQELKELLKAGYIFNRKQYKVLLEDIKEYLES